MRELPKAYQSIRLLSGYILSFKEKSGRLRFFHASCFMLQATLRALNKSIRQSNVSMNCYRYGTFLAACQMRRSRAIVFAEIICLSSPSRGI